MWHVSSLAQCSGGLKLRQERDLCSEPAEKYLKLRQERNMALLTELEFMPSSHYGNVAPDGAFNERQGIRGVPWHNKPHFMAGVSSRAGSVQKLAGARLERVQDKVVGRER